MRVLNKLTCCVICVFLTSGIEIVIGGGTCEEVRLTFVTSQIGKPKIVPSRPRKTSNLEICMTSGPTCCTRKMESKYLEKVEENLLKVIDIKTLNLQTRFENFINDFKGGFRNLIFEARNSTLFEISASLKDEVYSREVADLSSSLFEELITTSKQRRSNIQLFIDRFFERLFAILFEQSTFRKMTSQQTTCVLNQAKQGAFFKKMSSEITSKLSKLLHKTNIFIQSLEAGIQTIESLSTSVLGKQCLRSAVKMEYCSHCYGFTLIKPCQGLCTNVIRGCLVGINEVDFYWKHYIKALRHMGVILTSSGSDVESILRRTTEVLVESATSDIDKETIKKIKDVCKISKSRHRRSKNFPLNPPSRKKNGGKRKKRTRNVDFRKLGPNSLTSTHTYDPRGLVKPPYEMLRDLPIPFYPEVTKVSKNDVISEDKIDASFGWSRDNTKLHLNTKITRFLNLFNLSSNFFSKFPDELCDVNNALSFELATTGLCWDGQKMTSSYDKPVPRMDLENQFDNPEVTIDGIHGDVINAIESLRIGAKELFSIEGEVPRQLDQPPYYVTDGSTPPPCGDDEDSCDLGSGEFPSGNGPNIETQEQDSTKTKDFQIHKSTTKIIKKQITTTSLIVTSSDITTTTSDVIAATNSVTAAERNNVGSNNLAPRIYKNNLIFQTLAAQFFVFLVLNKIFF